MNISTATKARGSAGTHNKASIEKQIRRLEKKREELYRKLTGNKGSEESTAQAPQGTPVVNSQKVSGQGAGVPLMGAQTGDAASAAASGGDSSSSFMQNLQDLQSSLSSSQSPLEIEEDPEDILKQIQLVEMQIMTLRQRLGEDSMLTLVAGDEVDKEDLASTALSMATAKASQAEAISLPSPEVDAGGHVDGYV